MPLQVITNQQFCTPSAANSASVAATGVAWTNTTPFTQIVATTDVVWILTSVIVWTASAAVAVTDFEVDIAIGAVSSEVVIATVRGRHKPQGAAVCSQPIRLPIPIDNLNGRLSFRIRTGDTRTDTWNVALTFIKNPVSGTLLITKSPLLVAPAAANPIALTASNSAWLNGTPVQLIASTPSPIVVTHAVLHPGVISTEYEVDILTGASGHEVPVTTFRLNSKSTISSSPCVYELPNPLDNIPASTRVSLLARSSPGSGTVAAALMYHAKPL